MYGIKLIIYWLSQLWVRGFLVCCLVCCLDGNLFKNPNLVTIGTWLSITRIVSVRNVVTIICKQEWYNERKTSECHLVPHQYFGMNLSCAASVMSDHSSWTTVFIGMYTWVEYDFYTCCEGPPVLGDRFCWAEEVVSRCWSVTFVTTAQSFIFQVSCISLIIATNCVCIKA